MFDSFMYYLLLHFLFLRFVDKAEHLPLWKSCLGQLNIRINPETHSRIAILAKQTGVTINAFIRSALEKKVAMLI